LLKNKKQKRTPLWSAFYLYTTPFLLQAKETGWHLKEKFKPPTACSRKRFPL